MVTFTATDDCGLTSTTQATFTIEDTTVPSIDTAASNLTVECDGAGNTAELNAWLASNGGTGAASDICGSVGWTHDFTALSDDCGETGSAMVTFTATDDCGLTSTTQATFTIEDTTVPSISGCPSDITQDNDTGVCNAVVTWIPPTATDNCDPSPALTSTHVPGDTFPVGTTTVTYTATDACSNTSTCTFNVTVTDVEPPTTVLTVTPPDPDNNPDPYFEWTATDNNTCTAPANLVYSNRLDGGAWSAWSLPGVNYVTLAGVTEGTRTFEVRAMDEAGNIETTATYTWVLDLTDPEITITVPEDAAEYGLNDTVDSNWIAVDALSGLDTAVANDDVNTDMVSGEAFYTGTVGLHGFTVTATDLAGNTATETVEYRVVYIVNPGGAAAGGGGGVEGEGGTFLDKSIAGGGGAVGVTTLEAVYTVGDVIHVSFSLTNAEGDNIPDAVVSCTLMRVTLGEEEVYDVLSLWRFDYSADTELYSLDIVTEGLPAGIYDLWLGFDDGTQQRLRIQIEEGEG